MTHTAEYRLQKANEYLKEAELLYGEKIGNLPVLANLYHAMMNCLFALFEIEAPGGILHADIIERFRSEFVQTGIFVKKYADALDFAFHITHECNCDKMKPLEDRDIDKLFPVAREFLQTSTGHVMKNYERLRRRKNNQTGYDKRAYQHYRCGACGDDGSGCTSQTWLPGQGL
jgi:uncharacterized protein (UPF0332 family)